MNLRLTKKKFIAGLVAFLIIHVFFTSTIGCLGGGFCFYLPGYVMALFTPLVIVDIIVFLAAYIVWSLFEKP